MARRISGSASPWESRWPIPAPLSTSSNPIDGIGALPPIVLAALRKRMVALAAEIAQGVLFANASLSHMAQSLAVVPAAKRADPNFLVGNMLPVCISDDEGAAMALHRHRLIRYTMLPNYRNYWKEAGYIDEMAAIETAIAENRRDDIPKYLPDRWIADNTLYGPAGESARPARRLVRCRRQHPGARPQLGQRQPADRTRRNILGVLQLISSLSCGRR